MKTLWIPLVLVSASVLQVTCTGTGRHSLWILATHVSGPSQLPEFSGVILLDDLQVAYYDSTMDYPVVSSSNRTPVNLGLEAKWAVDAYISDSRSRMAFSKYRFNLTKGLHVEQKITGCEIQDGQITFLMSRNAYNGQDADIRVFNTTHFSYSGRGAWENYWSAAKVQFVQTLYHRIYHPLCEGILKHLLEQNKNLVTRRVRPRLRLFSKQVEGGALLTCLATDFYPRHINLTLLRDGRRVEEDRLRVGPVLPNGNGLYQVRKTLELTDQELKHNYTCTAEHLSLDNHLQVSWRDQTQHSHRAHWVPPLVLLPLVLLLVLVLVLAKCRRPQTPEATGESVAMETPETEQPPEGAAREEASSVVS